MGAWGIGPFDNDDAADLIGDIGSLPADKRAQRVRAALAFPDGYVEAPEGSAAVAAAALVAAANGMSADVPAEAQELIRPGTIPHDGHVRSQALAALSRVNAGDSEWHELWEEAGQLADATEMLDSIRAYL